MTVIVMTFCLLSQTRSPCCRSLVFYSKDVNKWCVPFLGCDRSVVYRTQTDNFVNKQEQPVSERMGLRLFQVHSCCYHGN